MDFLWVTLAAVETELHLELDHGWMSAQTLCRNLEPQDKNVVFIVSFMIYCMYFILHS